MRKRLLSTLARNAARDAKTAARDASRATSNPRHRLERIFADLRAGLLAAAAVLAFNLMPAPVALCAIVAFYFATPWEG